ncbi:MAG: glutamate formimidoyltransferase, partial [Thermoanaerobaculia bacterium]
MQIVECVPNISEGRRPEIYHAVADAAASVSGATLLNVDPGADTNRTVITFVGAPDAVLEAAFRLVKKGIELIDMSTHRGAHPRIGA